MYILDHLWWVDTVKYKVKDGNKMLCHVLPLVQAKEYVWLTHNLSGKYQFCRSGSRTEYILYVLRLHGKNSNGHAAVMCKEILENQDIYGQSLNGRDRKESGD